jgi:hypothetical protein
MRIEGTTDHGQRDLCEATVAPMTEGQFAERQRSEGHRVIKAHGRYWQPALPGFYDGLHWLARHSLDEVARPAACCWGYRAVLRDEDAHGATGALPAYVITDVAGYELDRLPPRTRRDIRAVERNGVRIVWLVGPDLLIEQGYEVVMSWLGRTRHRAPESRDEYVKAVTRNVRDRTRLVLAGIREGRLLGCSTSWIVGRTGYVWTVHLSDEALKYHLSSALWYETAQVLRRTGAVQEICGGLALPERSALDDYKARLGYEYVRLPTKVWLLPGVSQLLKARYPNEYYRLTGQGRDREGSTAPARRD